MTIGSNNYPPGADNTDAPWNEREQEEREFSLTVSQTLSKNVTVSTNDYDLTIIDEPNNGIHEENINTTDTSWSDVYAENDYRTPSQLIALFKRYLQYLLDDKTVVPTAPSFLKHLIEDCDNWVVDEEEFIEE